MGLNILILLYQFGVHGKAYRIPGLFLGSSPTPPPSSLFVCGGGAGGKERPVSGGIVEDTSL